jgi:RND family efflux transporter MFP subunit
MSEKTLKSLLPLIVLVIGAASAAWIVSARKAPDRVERPPLGPLVEVTRVELTDVPVVVDGHGEVVPRVAVDVVPQVAGRVVKVHPSLLAGGFFRAGEALVVIDPRDYELALERAQATVARAQVSLQREQAEAVVAREEWDELHPGEDAPGLVVREPQIRQAEAELAAAEADLAAAQLNLERTHVRLPFDGVVVSESVDVGQFVGSSNRLATVYGTDVVDVRVPLDSRELAWFDVPSRNGGDGPRAEVSVDFGGARSTWEGRVTRMEAQVDQSSRMVHVVVEVEDPYAATENRPALLPGTFVDVRIFGRTLTDVVPIPRYAVREGDQVWVYDDGKLAIRPVQVLRSDREQALVAEGLAADDLVIVSSLDAVTEGMAVRNAADQENAPPKVSVRLESEGPPMADTIDLALFESMHPPRADAADSTAIRVRELPGA